MHKSKQPLAMSNQCVVSLQHNARLLEDSWQLAATMVKPNYAGVNMIVNCCIADTACSHVLNALWRFLICYRLGNSQRSTAAWYMHAEC